MYITLISNSWLGLASAVRSLANQVSRSVFPLAPALVSLLLDEVQGKYYYWTSPVFFLQQRKITHFSAHPELFVAPFRVISVTSNSLMRD